MYDVTTFLKSHPGGERAILMSAGKNDSTNDFEAVGHSNRARRLLHKYQIGRLRPREDDEMEEEDSKQVKIDVKSHGHAHHYHNGSENIWLKDEPPGTKYIGKSGRSFSVRTAQRHSSNLLVSLTTLNSTLTKCRRCVLDGHPQWYICHLRVWNLNLNI